jgi:beta-propeller repeat-containing protein
VSWYDDLTATVKSNAFAVRLRADGTAFQGRFIFPGSGNDYASDIAVDPSGNVWVTGTTFSDDFKTTPNAIRGTRLSKSEAFLVRLNSTWDGFSYSTYLGDDHKKAVSGLLVDDIGRLYVIGRILQPINPGDPEIYDVWVARYTPSTNTASTRTVEALGNQFTSGCAMDNSRLIYIAGVTDDKDIATDGAFQINLKGAFDGFVAKVTF